MPQIFFQSQSQGTPKLGQALSGEPAPASGLKLVLTPKSKSKTPAPLAGAALPCGVPRSAQRTGSSCKDGELAAAEQEEGGIEATQELDMPEEVLAAAVAAPALLASARKTPVGTAMAPINSALKSIRRSASRTPGTKVVIIEQATQTTPACNAGGSVSANKSVLKSATRGAQTTARLLSTVGMQTEGAEEDSSGEEAEQSQEREDSLEKAEGEEGGAGIAGLASACCPCRAWIV